ARGRRRRCPHEDHPFDTAGGRSWPTPSLLVSTRVNRYPRPMTSGTSQRDRLTAIVRPVVVAAGYHLEELAITPAGRRRLVRVVLDADTRISLDDVAEVSQAISTALDEHDEALGRSPYVLEVSSPGVD